MKWQRFVSSMGLSKLFKGLMALVLIKFCLLALVGWQTLSTHPDLAKAPAVVKMAAVAAAPNSAQAQAETATQAPAQPQDGAAAAGAPTADNITASALQKRQDELDRRDKELKILETKIQSDMAELDKRRAQMEQMLEDAKAVRDKKDRHLVDVFSNMKAKQAAQVLETMEERQAVKILSGMSGRQAGEILTFVNSDKAAKLAEALTRLQVPFE